MRGLEHYLNDIMRPPPDATDVKGQFVIFIIYTNRINSAKSVTITQTLDVTRSPLNSTHKIFSIKRFNRNSDFYAKLNDFRVLRTQRVVFTVGMELE